MAHISYISWVPSHEAPNVLGIVDYAKTNRHTIRIYKERKGYAPFDCGPQSPVSNKGQNKLEIYFKRHGTYDITGVVNPRYTPQS